MLAYDDELVGPVTSSKSPETPHEVVQYVLLVCIVLPIDKRDHRPLIHDKSETWELRRFLLVFHRPVLRHTVQQPQVTCCLLSVVTVSLVLNQGLLL